MKNIIAVINSSRGRAVSPVSLAVLLFLSPALCSSGAKARAERAAEDRPFQRAWISDPYWTRGEAELSRYAGTVIRYGQPRSADLVFVVVTEKMRRDQLVKANQWNDPQGMLVFHVNQILSFTTGVYSYRQMGSFFRSAADWRPIKMTLGSQEWCGNTFKEIITFGDRNVFRFHSYWQDEGDGEVQLKWKGDFDYYDNLPLLLRALSGAGPWKLNLVESQFSNRAPVPKLMPAEIRIAGNEALAVEGKPVGARIFEVKHEGKTDRYWVANDFPNLALQWKRSDGVNFTLKKSRMLKYWELHNPGDENKF